MKRVHRRSKIRMGQGRGRTIPYQPRKRRKITWPVPLVRKEKKDD